MAGSDNSVFRNGILRDNFTIQPTALALGGKLAEFRAGAARKRKLT
jgi:hypothetical protein